ncbi:unnamed protein product [Knipowitschia caucasica]
MIDLSFLTEEEQEVILGVLKRDADLKRAEEQRVQKLQQIICDRARLKYLTGEWFYETKQLRHQERIHGSDIIWASMKHTHKPMTILELSQIVPNRPSFVSGENKEVFVPAVLCGLLQEPTPGPCNTWKDDPNPYETGPIKPMSPTKRKNPFNNQAVEDVFTELRDRPTLPQLPSENNEHISDHVNPYGPFQNQDPSSPLFLISQKSALKPVPEENNEEMEDAVDTSNCVVSRGILKFLANTAMLEAQGTVRAESPVDSWADQKPVRVSSALSESGGRIQDGKELGEHSLLDVDTPTEWTVSGQDSTHAKDKAREPECKSTNWKVAVQEGSQETNDGPEWCEAQSPKPPAPSATLETGDPACVESEDGHVPPPSDKQITSESSKKNLSTVSPSTRQRILGFFKRQKNIQAKKQIGVRGDLNEKSILQILNDNAMISVETPSRTVEDAEVDHPALVSDIENSATDMHEDTADTKAKSCPKLRADSHGNQLRRCSEDGTYRAFPVLIYEDSEDSLVCSIPETQISEPKSKPSPVALPKQMSHIPPDDKPANVGELKNFWEECSGGRTSAPCSPVHTSKSPAAASPLRSSASQKKQHPVPLSPTKIVTIKSVIVNDRGFVSQTVERSPSQGASVLDVLKRVNEGTHLLEVPQSPSKSPSKRSKDDEVRLSPSKTCHPRVLPRESVSPEGSRPASPLKTFPILIDPSGKSRPSKSPSPEASILEGSETKRGSPLARSVIPQDYQHYLGPREQAHLPPFEEASAVDVLRRPQSPMGEFVENQNKDPRVSSWIEQIRESGDDTRAWSLSRASAGSYEEGSGPVMSALKRLSTKMSSSKSLENLTSPTREEKEQLNKSVDDVSEFPSTTFSTTKKSSVSVPAFQLDETDSDSPLENNLSYRRNTGSSASNISLSSGMASMSSVGGSMTSIYHNDLGDVDVQGTIQFAVNYIQKLGEFHIFVVHCRDLAVGDSKKSRSDPYVKCYLVPDKTKLGKRKTSIKKKTVNPTYNEILRFKILLEVLKFQHLNVSVWHNDTFGRNSFLGEVDLDLSQWDFSNAQISEYSLKARASSAALTSTPSPTRTTDSSRGQMRVAVRFLPQTSPSKRTSRNETGEVQIWVKDCKNLPPIRGVIIDPFVKCTVLPDTSRKSRQKTRVVKRTANPMFNHTMVYDGFRSEDLKEACVELTVWDHDRLNNHYIGGVRLGLGTGKSYGVDVNWMDSTTSEASLWQRMLDSAGEWLEDVLPLRMLLMAKSMSN